MISTRTARQAAAAAVATHAARRTPAAALTPATATATAASAASAARLFSTSVPASSMVGRKVLKFSPEVSISVEPFAASKSFPSATTQAVVKGPLGTLRMPIQPFVSLDFPPVPADAPKRLLAVAVSNPKEPKQRAMWGTTRALLANMVTGVSEGYMIPVRLVGVGYRALMEQGKLSLKLGYAHPILLDIPEGVNVSIPAPQRILLQGNDLQAMTLFAAKIRKWRKPEPYNQKGIFVGDETIKKKDGKKR
ncbi:ribosomal protein L6, alpha-beta domain-containing protein [Entophlyctis helioformis]|nr:ribosomal protein L6, alpha-beta domain-containing protein [Entophlyctis helioformis]